MIPSLNIYPWKHTSHPPGGDRSPPSAHLKPSSHSAFTALVLGYRSQALMLSSTGLACHKVRDYVCLVHRHPWQSVMLRSQIPFASLFLLILPSKALSNPFLSIPVAISLVGTTISLASGSATASWLVSPPPGLPLTDSFSVRKPELSRYPNLASVIPSFPSTVISFELLEFLRLSLSSRLSPTWNNYLASKVSAIVTAGERTSLNMASVSPSDGQEHSRLLFSAQQFICFKK